MVISLTEDTARLLLMLGETQDESIFSKYDLDMLLTNSHNLDEAASTGWLMKADRLIAQYPLASISLGSESYKFQSISEIMDYCRERSLHYAKFAGKASGIVLAMTPIMGGDTP